MPYKWCLQEHKAKGDSVDTNVWNSFPSRGCLFMVLKQDPYNQIEKSISFQAITTFLVTKVHDIVILSWVDFGVKDQVHCSRSILHPSTNLYQFPFCAVDFAKHFNLHLPNAWTNLNWPMNLFIFGWV
jgi:hypothetical protein